MIEDYTLCVQSGHVRNDINQITEYYFMDDDRSKDLNISCMSIIIFRYDRENRSVLLLQKDNEWVFPKGHHQPGESYILTAIREVVEEAGIQLREANCIGKVDEFAYDYDGEEQTKRILVYAFTIFEQASIQISRNEGFSDGQWFPVQTAIDLITHSDAREALLKALEFELAITSNES